MVAQWGLRFTYFMSSGERESSGLCVLLAQTCVFVCVEEDFGLLNVKSGCSLFPGQVIRTKLPRVTPLVFHL